MKTLSHNILSLFMRRKAELFFLLFLPLFLPHIIFSQYKNLQFSSLTVNDGLSEDKVSCILQDSKGFMWFGTESGLNRFDGYNFKIYSHDPNKIGTISDNRIDGLYEDREGTLWVGTIGGGLNKYDRNLDRFAVYKSNPLDSKTISGNTIRVIFEDSKGNLWVGTRFNGLNRFDRKKESFTHYKHNPGDSSSISYAAVWSICEDSFGNLWMGTSGSGLDRFDVKTGKFTHFRNNPVDSNSLSQNQIRCMYLDKNQNLWIGTLNGINKLALNEIISAKSGSIKFKRYYIKQTVTRVEALCMDDNGFLWIGTWEGIAILDPESEHFITYSKNAYNGLLGNAINSIFEDKSGIIWIAVGGFKNDEAMRKGGINTFDRKRLRFNVYWYNSGLPNSLNIGRISTFLEDKDNNLWIAANGESSIWKWNKSENTLKKITPNITGEATINGLFIDSKNAFWLKIFLPKIGPSRQSNISFRNQSNISFRNRGICRFDPVSMKIIEYLHRDKLDTASSLDIVFEDKRGFFWLTSSFGLYEADSEMNVVKVYKHSDNDPGSIDDNWVINVKFEDNDANLWVVTRSGLNKLDRKTERFTHYHNVFGDMRNINSSRILAINYDNEGNLWFADYGTGLIRLDKQSGIFTHITKENGLADNFINSLLTDNHGNFWIGSNSGISKYNPKDGTIKNYGIEDGLQGKEFSLPRFKSKSGEMFFGGYFGLNTFFPDSIKDNQFVPPVVLTSFKLFDKEAELDTSITYKTKITLPYDSNFFSFEFSALNYTNPTKNRYAYKLEGVDKDWVYTEASNRTASYTNIDPGNYVFRVKGSNNDGVWNEVGTSVRITLTPPWWQTWWFRAMALFAIAGTFGGSVRYITIQRYKRRLALEKERTRISKDMHDEVGSSLTKISILSELTKQKTADPKLKSDVEKISESASEVVDNISEIIWALNPKNDTLDNLLAYIREYTAETLEMKNVDYKIDLPENIPFFSLSAEIRRNIFLVVKEALNNIIKYAQSSLVNISVTLHESRLEITIKDNGKGFDVENTRRFGNGLINMKKRMDDIYGKFELDSKIGIGTEIRISLRLSG